MKIFGKMFKIIYSETKALKKDKGKITKNHYIAKKIKFKIEELAKNPFSKDLNTKKLEPKENNEFRIKIWDYRIIYSIDTWNKIILIHRIWLRKDIYKQD